METHGAYSHAVEPDASQPLTDGQRFALNDRELDRAQIGPMWLHDQRIAARVADTFFRGQHEWKLYQVDVAKAGRR